MFVLPSRASPNSVFEERLGIKGGAEADAHADVARAGVPPPVSGTRLNRDLIAGVGGFLFLNTWFLFLNTLYLQDVRGLSPIGAGLATLPMAVMTILISPLSGRLVGRRGPRLPLVLSGVGTMAASAMLTTVGPRTAMPTLLVAYAVFGIGFGFVNAPITNAAVSGMPREKAGVASAVARTSRQFGQTLGAAIIGAVVASRHGAGLASASHPAFWTLTAFGGLCWASGFWPRLLAPGSPLSATAADLNPEALAAVATSR